MTDAETTYDLVVWATGKVELLRKGDVDTSGAVTVLANVPKKGARKLERALWLTTVARDGDDLRIPNMPSDQTEGLRRVDRWAHRLLGVWGKDDSPFLYIEGVDDEGGRVTVGPFTSLSPTSDGGFKAGVRWFDLKGLVLWYAKHLRRAPQLDGSTSISLDLGGKVLREVVIKPVPFPLETALSYHEFINRK